MEISARIHLKNSKTEYPFLGILMVMGLVLLSPFVSAYLCYLAFLLCIYRILRYDAKVFATDYCILLPVSQFFRTTGGMSLVIWICLLAAIWYFVRGKIRVNGALVCLILLLNYLITRMQMNISSFVLCFGQLFMLYVLLPKQDSESAERTIKAFCWSLLLTSIYALSLRNVSQIASIRGEEVLAYWGSTLKRFQGLVSDPNYYMTLLIVGIALLTKLRECRMISTGLFLGMAVAFALFGILTFSKTFFIVFILLVLVCIVWQFWNRRYLAGTVLIMAATVIGVWLLLSENTLVAVVLYRLASANTLSEFTTGRTDIYAEYWLAITENMGNVLFGLGLDAPMLSKAPHNLYLEYFYLIGAIGLVLVLVYYVCIVRMVNKMTVGRQNVISRYVVMLMVVVMYFALHGMTSMFSYASFFLAFLAMMVTRMKEAN